MLSLILWLLLDDILLSVPRQHNQKIIKSCTASWDHRIDEVIIDCRRWRMMVSLRKYWRLDHNQTITSNIRLQLVFFLVVVVFFTVLLITCILIIDSNVHSKEDLRDFEKKNVNRSINLTREERFDWGRIFHWRKMFAINRWYSGMQLCSLISVCRLLIRHFSQTNNLEVIGI